MTLLVAVKNKHMNDSVVQDKLARCLLNEMRLRGCDCGSMSDNFLAECAMGLVEYFKILIQADMACVLHGAGR